MMNTNKIGWIFCLFFFVLTVALLAGCQPKADFPFYQLETLANNSEIIYIDDVQYRRAPNAEPAEQAYYCLGKKCAWTAAAGLGKQIGVCGDAVAEAQEASLKIFAIAGDEEHFFLYTCPANFYFGGVDIRLWQRDGVSLAAPSTETVASVKLVCQQEEKALVIDEALLAVLLTAFNSDSPQAMTDSANADDWQNCSLIMQHQEYPFLQYEIACRCSVEQGVACWQNSDGQWFVLPDEWFEILAQYFC